MMYPESFAPLFSKVATLFKGDRYPEGPLVQLRLLDDGAGIFVAFRNGYAADIVSHSGSIGGAYGLWEIAVCAKTQDGGFKFVYDTPITDDVIGDLDEDEALEICREIQNLPDRG